MGEPERNINNDGVAAFNKKNQAGLQIICVMICIASHAPN